MLAYPHIRFGCHHSPSISSRLAWFRSLWSLLYPLFPQFQHRKLEEFVQQCRQAKYQDEISQIVDDRFGIRKRSASIDPESIHDQRAVDEVHGVGDHADVSNGSCPANGTSLYGGGQWKEHEDREGTDGESKGRLEQWSEIVKPEKDIYNHAS